MRAVLKALPCVAAIVITGCGGGHGSNPSATEPFVAIGKRQAHPPPPHAAPRWQTLGSFSGIGSAVRAVDVSRIALQWRVAWRCQRGRLNVHSGSGSARAERLVGSRCPASGQAFSLSHGRLALRVQSPGPWRLNVAQELDSPIHEPPLHAMSAPGSRRIAHGRFYDIERKGKGVVLLYRLADGRRAIRFENFSTTTNTDLVVWLSSAPRPPTSSAAFRAAHTVVAPLKSTIGSQNYLVPRSVPAQDLHSVVLWCVPQRIAYAGATLRPWHA